MSVENLLARLTPQSVDIEPRQSTGGKPELTVGDISLIASQAPHMSFHALMTKCCADQISAKRLYIWLHDTSLTEWFLNPAHDRESIVIGQANRLVELAFISWAIPRAPEASTLILRAAYVHSGHDSFRRKYQVHYNRLVGELDFLEQVGREAINGFNQRYA
jgi:hypothetical protein